MVVVLFFLLLLLLLLNTSLPPCQTQSVMELLKEEVVESLLGASWMSPEEQTEAVKKVVALGLEVGAYENHWDISFVNKSHSGVSVCGERVMRDRENERKGR